MSPTADEGRLDTCGCCEAVAPAALVHNRPGLSALAYRVGTHGSFLARMRARLAAETVEAETTAGAEQTRPLEKLTTRETSDPAIAMLDAWAMVADVLTFYQERIANEGYLRTASERRSVLELARAIGYELSPGVAAATYLAFTVEDAPGAPRTANVVAGTKVRSIPAENQLPQVFETVEDLTANADWNAMRMRTTQPQAIDATTRELFVSGTDLRLNVGDPLLFVGTTADSNPFYGWALRFIDAVTVRSDLSATRVSWTGTALSAADYAQVRVFVMRERAALFGHNAPDWKAMAATTQANYPGGTDDWPGLFVSGNDLALDREYPSILGGFVLAVDELPTYRQEDLLTIQSVRTQSMARFAMSGKATVLTVAAARTQLSRSLSFAIRSTSVYAASEELHLAAAPFTAAISGKEIELARVYPGLKAGLAVIVTGTVGGTSDPQNEVAVIGAVTERDGCTVLTLKDDLGATYNRRTTSVCANVALATHGETVREVLGSGDGSKANQRFTLKKPPLTYVAGANASGARSTLVVRVDGAAWKEEPSLYGLEATQRSFITRFDDEGRTSVVFGDGASGARLSSGPENVVATYRSGIGADGEVEAHTLALLQTRPLGVRGVTNPLAAGGAAAPERIEQARHNAPLKVLTLDRIVSRRDYEDFTRGFAGVGKVLGTELWAGENRVVHLTIASESGKPIDPNSPLWRNLLRAMKDLRDPVRPVLLDDYTAVPFDLRVAVLVDAALEGDVVRARVKEAMLAAFSFAARDLGQAVTTAAVIQVAQSVAGVTATAVERLQRSGGATHTGKPPPAILRAKVARRANAKVRRTTGRRIMPAELLYLDPDGLTVTEMTA